MQENELCTQLETVDRSLFFLTLSVVSVLLSFWSVKLQRQSLAAALAGCPTGSDEEEILPIKLIAGSLVTASLGFFFHLAIQSLHAAEAGTDPAARRSARINFWASLFVLAAALLRLEDLVWGQEPPPAEESTLPA